MKTFRHGLRKHTKIKININDRSFVGVHILNLHDGYTSLYLNSWS